MKYYTEGHLPLCMVSAIVTQASGLQFFSYRPSVSYDSKSNWLSEDLELYQQSVFDSFLDEIEEDLKSVWSTNKSEKESAIFSAERSAEADANGLATDLSGATG